MRSVRDLECGVCCLIQPLVSAVEFGARGSMACSLGASGDPLGPALTDLINELTEDTCGKVGQS